MLKEFKAFIMTGNVIEFAIAVILAGAVSLVVTGFVNDIMMPIIGEVSGGMDFSRLSIELSPGNAIRYGAWINTIINLVIVGFVLFMMGKAYNKTKKKKEEAPAAAPAPTKDQALLEEIRDLLKK